MDTPHNTSKELDDSIKKIIWDDDNEGVDRHAYAKAKRDDAAVLAATLSAPSKTICGSLFFFSVDYRPCICLQRNLVRSLQGVV
jgi:hypothetical protein